MTGKPTTDFRTQATAADVARNFGRFRELAQREPVAITSHGRHSLVLLSADEYARLKSLDDRVAAYASELPDELRDALSEAEAPAWTARFNAEYTPD